MVLSGFNNMSSQSVELVKIWFCYAIQNLYFMSRYLLDQRHQAAVLASMSIRFSEGSSQNRLVYIRRFETRVYSVYQVARSCSVVCRLSSSSQRCGHIIGVSDNGNSDKARLATKQKLNLLTLCLCSQLKHAVFLNEWVLSRTQACPQAKTNPLPM